MNSKKLSLVALAGLLSAHSVFAMGKAPSTATDSKPAVADPTQLTPEQGTAVKNNMNLEYLKLTPEAVRERDQKLAVIYDYYRDATVTKAIGQIQSTFATNVYHFQSTDKGMYTASLDDKASTMDSIIRYYTDFELEGTPFADASPAAVPQKSSVNIAGRELNLDRITDDGSMAKVKSFKSPFLISTRKVVEEHGYRHQILGYTSHSNHEGIYTSTQSRLFEVPVVDNFIQAMKGTNLKALDATVVFTAGTVGKETGRSYQCYENGYYRTCKESTPLPFQVVYPTLSRTAPIPQPVVFISESASEDEIEKLLSTHAPRIFAYNQLFNANLLPEIEDLEKALKNHPEILKEVQKVKADANAANTKEALHQAFLTVAYGMVVAGVGVASLPAMLASPILAPIIISTTVVVMVSG